MGLDTEIYLKDSEKTESLCHRAISSVLSLQNPGWVCVVFFGKIPRLKECIL